MDKRQADKILTEVKNSYEIIADHFSRTRYRDWSEFTIFKNYIKSGDKVLDAGCGNGRLYESLKELKIKYIGIDISPKLIKKAQSKYTKVKFKVADILKTPFPDQQFNVLLSIATLHHTPSVDYQKQVIKEFCRVLKPSGYLMITVWNLRQKDFQARLKKLPAELIMAKEDQVITDVFWPWKNPQGQVLTKRYLHGFSRAELAELVSLENFQIKEIFYSRKSEESDEKQGYNLCLIAQKVV